MHTRGTRHRSLRIAVPATAAKRYGGRPYSPARSGDDGSETQGDWERLAPDNARTNGAAGTAGFWQGTTGVGTVHHVAWRTADAHEAQAWHTTLSTAGLAVTPLVDRRYFQSIYVREPGGVILEIATDGPGFTVDEPIKQVGAAVQPPPGVEPEWQVVARTLPLGVPGGEHEASQEADG